MRWMWRSQWPETAFGSTPLWALAYHGGPSRDRCLPGSTARVMVFDNEMEARVYQACKRPKTYLWAWSGDPHTTGQWRRID